MADYIFYRTFDVQRCTILDNMDDKVGGLEIKFIFNRKESENASSVPKLDSDRKDDNKNTTACNETLQLSTQNPPGVGVGLRDVAATSVEIGKTTRCVVNSDEDEINVSKVPVNQVEVKERIKSAKDSDALEDELSKKAGVDNSIKLSGEKKLNCEVKSPRNGNDVKALVTTGSFKEKSNHGHGTDSLGPDKGVKFAKDSGDLEGRPSKKARVDISLELSEDKNRNSVQKLSTNYIGNNANHLIASVTSSEEKRKSSLALDSLGMKGPKKEQPDEKTRKLSNGKLPKVSAPESADEDMETGYQEFEVTRRPDSDKSKWFRELAWEERIQSAQDKGTLVLLRNLDPEYTSGEVEDIIYHAFKETCTAKMVQRTAISSPHSGQALVIFKTREVTERVIRKLDAGCLMLSNGRPVVGSTVPPSFSRKQSTFFGHLVIDKIKLQMQREMKEAVSTSHCSQPNTSEYEMAMDWCLQQSRSEVWWKSLYKHQGEELRKLVGNLKRK